MPLSGRYRQYGERALTAIELASRDHDVQLVVRDTAGEPNRASAAVSELAARRVKAIVGPITSKAALAAAQRAQESCVPMVSLSHRAGITDIGPWVFRSALTANAQARALAEVAFRDLHMKRFALLFPSNTYGEEFALAFWDEVDRREGEIRSIEIYDPSETVFRGPVQRLVGLYDAEAPLWPIVDFDAVVIPDIPMRLGMVVPALSVADVILTQDERHIRRIKRALEVDRIDPVRLLGGSTWNDDETLKHCGHDCEWAVFVDAFFRDSPAVPVRDFVSAFRDERDSAPRLLDATAFDTAAMIAEMIEDGSTDREALRDQLYEVRHDGLTGTLKFSETGEVNRALQTLTIRNRAIRAWKR